jgi:putative Mg2+ transporter-C (MgtC) family protein
MNRNNVSKFKEKRIYSDPLIMGILLGILIVSIFLALISRVSQQMIYSFINKIGKLISRNISQTQLDHIVRIVFSAFAGGIIGFEREYKNRPAGLRTHALVSIGATMVMLIPMELVHGGMETSRMDVTRLGAQVISGIGFLGAGTIIRNGESVKGLTTAASLWVSAILGLSIGAGNYMTSFISLVIVIFILKIFGIFGHPPVLKCKDLIFDVTMDNMPQRIGLFNIKIKIIKSRLRLQKLEIDKDSEKLIKSNDSKVHVKLFIRCSMDMEEDMLINELKNIPGVIEVNNNTLNNPV